MSKSNDYIRQVHGQFKEKHLGLNVGGTLLLLDISGPGQVLMLGHLPDAHIPLHIYCI